MLVISPLLIDILITPNPHLQLQNNTASLVYVDFFKLALIFIFELGKNYTEPLLAGAPGLFGYLLYPHPRTKRSGQFASLTVAKFGNPAEFVEPGFKS